MTILAFLLGLLLPAPQRVVLEPPAGTPPAVEGAALVVRGQLREGRQEVAEEFGVVVELRRAGDVLQRAAGCSDEAGAFEVELERPAGDGLLLVGWVEEPGYRRFGSTRTIAQLENAVDLGVRPRTGTTAIVRVVDARGREVLGESLTLQAFGSATPTSGGSWCDRSAKPSIRRRNRTGEFELDLRGATEAYLLARADGVGVGVLRTSLDPARRDDSFEVVLEGPAALAGKLTDPNGRGIGGVKLAAFSAVWIRDEHGPSRLAHELAPTRELRGGGLALCLTTTDEQGRFVFCGLRPGGYFVQDPRYGEDPLRLDLPRQLFPTDGEAADLVARNHTVELVVRDASGAAIDVRPYCVQLPEAVPRGPGGVDPGGTEVGSATWRFEVEPNRRYACGWFDPERGRVERVVVLASQEFHRRVELRGAERVEPANVTLELRGPGGAPYETSLDEDLWIGLRSLQTGKELVAERLYDHNGSLELLLRVPPGDYRAFALPTNAWRLCGNDPEVRIDRVLVERRITLQPGEERTVQLCPAVGGRVRLHLQLPEFFSDPRLRSEHLEDEDADWPRRSQIFYAGDKGPGARVWLLERDGPRPLFFHGRSDLSWNLPWIIPGVPAESFTPLPPGAARLRIETPGFATVERSVDVREGETVDAVVRLRPAGADSTDR